MKSTINLGKNKPGSTAIEQLKVALLKKDSNLDTAEFSNIILELEHEHLELIQKTHDLHERTKELSLFFHIFELVIQEDISENEFLQSLTDKIPETWKYPEHACARILYGNQEFTTSNFKQTPWCLSADIMVNHKKAGSIEVYYLEKIPENADDLFLKEERELIKSIAIKTGHYFERKIMREELVKSEERWHFALEGAGDGVWDWNLETNEVFFSDQWKKMLGYEPHEIKNEYEEWKNRVHPDDLEKANEDIHKHLNHEQPYYLNEHRLHCKDGSFKWILDRGKIVSSDKNGKPQRFIGTHTDITKLKRAEELIWERERQLNSMVNNLSGFVYRCKFDENYTMLNLSQQFEKITGYPSADFINNNKRTFNSMIHKNFQSGIFKEWEEAIAEKSFFEAEYPILTSNNQLKWIWERGTGVFDDNGNVLFLEGYIEDVSERKNNEIELKESESRFSTAFKASPAPLVISEIETGLFIDVNDRWIEMLGYSRQEQIGKTSKEVGIWRNPSERDRVIKQVFKNGFFKDEYIEFNTKTGETILALWSAETIMLSGKKLMLSMIHDITERVKAENELRKLKDSLQEMVEEKTKELNQRIEILERFHDATIEREFRINELKKEIKRLKADKT
jgi:PAS domain S-box-containing protein